MAYELLGTQLIQQESLRLFMASLGYFPARPNGGFRNQNPELAANAVLSTRTAIKLHNLSRSEWVKTEDGRYAAEGLNLTLRLNDYAVNVSQAAKMVHEVKLVPNKKAVNGFTMPVDANANLIRVTHPEYWEMFGIPQE